MAQPDQTRRQHRSAAVGGSAGGRRDSQDTIAQLIEFTRRNYNVVNADLPDTFDETTLAVLRDANKILLVTTPELPALRLAHLKVLLLKKLELFDKVSLVVNRVSGRMELTFAEIEKTVGLPVYMSFPSDYADVTAAIRAGRPSPKLAASVQKFAALLLDRETEPRKHAAFHRTFWSGSDALRIPLR